MTALALHLESPIARTSERSSSRLLVTTSGIVAFVMLQLTESPAQTVVPYSTRLQQSPPLLADDADRFFADLCELGGMTVIA